MDKKDKKLGMDQKITRRDFVQGLSLTALGLTTAETLNILSSSTLQASSATNTQAPFDQSDYPPIRTGLRGSHPGAFENAHALAREGKKWQDGKLLDETYDLIIVGGGISGLATAYYYQKQKADARILILENHDDFGGHAKRNEFHQGGEMRLSWGGTMNLEYTYFSDTAHALMKELGIDIDETLKLNDFKYGYDGKNGPGIYFDKESYGKDVLTIPCSFRDFDINIMAEQVDEFPISEQSRKSLKTYLTARKNIKRGMSEEEIHQMLHQTSYIDFLTRYGGVTKEAAELFVKVTDGYAGVSAHSLSVAECIGAGLPIKHILGEQHTVKDKPVGGDVAMFPDGNATVARLLVRKLIPNVATGSSIDDIVTAKFDYTKLDHKDSNIRLRLNATAVKVKEQDQMVNVTYAKGKELFNVRAKHCVLACYHSIIPHLCPEMSEAQKEACRYQVKRPLLVTNVLLKNSHAADKLGISGAYCPGRMHGATWLVKGVHSADYRHEWDDDGPVTMMFWGAMAPSNPDQDIKAQHRDSRLQMLAKPFEEYEREVRTVLDGMLGSAGFDAKNDILAITVNRWPHGYAHDYLDLWDPKWPEGQAPHEIARKKFGNIAIANSDAGAMALTNVATDEALRAVNELLTA